MTVFNFVFDKTARKASPATILAAEFLDFTEEKCRSFSTLREKILL